MPRSSTLVLADLITANRLPSFRIGIPAPTTTPIPTPIPNTTPIPIQAPAGPDGSTVDTESSDWNLDALTGRLVELSTAGPSVALTAASALVVEAQLRREPAAWIAIGEATFYPPDLAEAGCDLANLPVVRVEDARTAARAADLLLRSGGFRIVVIDGVGSPYLRTPRLKTGTRSYAGYGPAYSQNADRQALDVLSGPVKRTRVSEGSASDRRYDSNASRSRGISGEAPPDGGGARFRSASSRRGRFDDPYHRDTSASIPPAAQTRLAGLTKRHQAVLVCITHKERGVSSLGPLVSLRGTGRVRKTAFDRFTWELEALKDKRRAPGWEHSGVCRGPTGLF